MIRVKKISSDNLNILRLCENIAIENLIENGGELQFSKTIYECDEIYCILKNETIVGYVALKYGYRLKDDAYIMQVAIKKDFQRKGYGTILYNYIKKDLININYLTCDIKEKNINSINFHIKNGFIPKKYVNLILYQYKLQ